MVLAGVMISTPAAKAARFVRFATASEIPILTLVDVPGFLLATRAQADGVIKRCEVALFAWRGDCQR